MNFLFGKSSTKTSTPAIPAPTDDATTADSPPVIAEAINIPVTVSSTLIDDEEGVPLHIEKMEISDTKQLDLVFLMDCTGSMGSYIEEAKNSIQSIITKLNQEEKCDVRFALVAYRDHPPQDSTFITKIFPFTAKKEAMQKYLDSLSASGGGDGPEAVTAGLYATENLPYRPNATKICILIADAPPHGLGENGDGFPNGDPDGHDPLVIARSMATKGITIYPVGCEPALSNYRNAKAFMVGLAEITDGYATSLSSSTLLADIILGGTAEEVGLHDLASKYEAKMVAIQSTLETRKGAPVTEHEVATELFAQMQSDGVQTKAWNCDGKISDSRSGYYTKNARLSDARSEIVKKEGSSSGYGGGGGTGSVERFRAARMPTGSAPRSLPPPKSSSSSSTSWFSFGAPAPAAASSRRAEDVDALVEESDELSSGSKVYYAAPSSSATSSTLETKDVSYEQVLRVFSKAKKQGKV